MLQGYPSRSKAATIAAAILLLLLGSHVLRSHPPPVPRWNIADGEAAVSGNADAKVDSGALPCQKLPGAEDVVVIMRTGATEIQDKLPIHLNTTFRCYQDVIIFSDYAETFQGHPVHDVFGSMDQQVVESNPDFGLYRRLRRNGRASLTEDELSGKASFEGSKSGKGENPGWKLDKWKFLPMMNETLKLRPNKKWYIYIESDSYPVWSNLLQWFEKLDPSQPHYYGSEVQIGPDIFAHGGSVFVMSRPAVELSAEYYANNRQEWDDFTNGHWAGDCVLGKELRLAGAPLEWAYPMFQGGHPEKMDFTEKKGNDKKLWCVPALSYHHFSPSETQRMWDFEQMWIESRLAKVKASANTRKRWSFWEDYSDVLEHRDVFREFVWPQIRAGQPGFWNNLSPDMRDNSGGSNEDACRELCQSTSECLQYASGTDGCAISTRQVMLGERQAGFKSGWMLDRIEKWMETLNNCGGSEGWTVT